MTEPEVPTDNPAGRLYDILSRTRQTNSTGTVLDALCSALAVNPSDVIGSSYAFTQLLCLINDTALAIWQLEGYKYKRY